MRQRDTLIAILVVLLAAAIAVPWSLHDVRKQAEGRLVVCVANLRNIDMACQMMSTDSTGRYPVTLAQLTPNFLKVIPTCPAAGTDTYSPAFTSASNPDEYTVFCLGEHHSDAGVSRNQLRSIAREGVDIDHSLVEIRARTRRHCQGQARGAVLTYLGRNGIQVGLEDRDGVLGSGPSNRFVMLRIRYFFCFGEDGRCTDVDVSY